MTSTFVECNCRHPLRLLLCRFESDCLWCYDPLGSYSTGRSLLGEAVSAPFRRVGAIDVKTAQPNL